MKQKIIPVWKNIKKLDIQIRTIEHQDFSEEKEPDYYYVEVGLFESLGEQGDILTLTYDEKPTEQEIIKDTIEELKQLKIDFEGNICMSGREEEHFKALNRISHNLK